MSRPVTMWVTQRPRTAAITLRCKQDENQADRIRTACGRHPPLGAAAASSSRLQPRNLGIEFEPQLRGFFLRQPPGHLRKDGTIHQELVPIPGKLFRRAGLGKNPMQPRTDLVRIGPIGWRGRLGFEQFGLCVGLEQVLLG